MNLKTVVSLNSTWKICLNPAHSEVDSIQHYVIHPAVCQDTRTSDCKVNSKTTEEH
jgi:hypothetical protein